MLLVCESGGCRLDVWLAANLEAYTRTGAQKLIIGGCVSVNGARANKNYTLKNGDTVVVDMPPPAPQGFAAQDIALDVVYEDAYLIVVNKPRGMVAHPGAGNRDGTLANALAFHCAGGLSSVGGAARPGIVHRLDKETSGLIVAAKTDEAHVRLAEEFKRRRVRKIYEAVVAGDIKPDSGWIEMPIGRHPVDRKRMAALAEGGKPAITLFKVKKRLPDGRTWLELDLITGRTHQIRVHLAQIGHPVCGDTVYGRGGEPGGMLLHAARIEFTHPSTGRRVSFSAPLPDDFPKL